MRVQAGRRQPQPPGSCGPCVAWDPSSDPLCPRGGGEAGEEQPPHPKLHVMNIRWSAGGRQADAAHRQARGSPTGSFQKRTGRPAGGAGARGGSAHRDGVVLDHVHLRVVGVDVRRGRQLHGLERRLQHRAEDTCHPSRGSGGGSARSQFIHFPVGRNTSEGQREDSRHSVSGAGDRGRATRRVPRDFRPWVAGLRSTWTPDSPGQGYTSRPAIVTSNGAAEHGFGSEVFNCGRPQHRLLKT